MNSIEKTSAYRRFLLFAQLATILAPFSFFFDSAIIYRGRINLSVFTATTVFLVLNVGLIVLIVLSIRYFHLYCKNQNCWSLGDQNAKDRPTIKNRILSFLPVTVVASLFSVLAALQFSSLPRYDGGLYYAALLTATENFTFTPNSLISSFTFYTHPMQGTSLLIGMGEMLFPRQVIGVYGVTLLLTILAIFCLYSIFGRIFPDKPAWLKAAGTAVFAFCPYLLGLFSHFTPDYFSAMFFVILIYAFSKELDYLAAFMSLLLVFSKETGILFAASFLVPVILLRAGSVEGGNYIKKLMRYIFPKRLLLYSVAPLLFLYVALVKKALTYGQSRTGLSPFRWDNNMFFCFGYNPRYISARLEQFLLTNFFWLITLLAILALLLILFRKYKSGDLLFSRISTDSALVAGITISTIVYALFSCLFITIPCPRYNVLFALPACLICVWAVSNIWKNQTIVKIIMSLVVIFFLLQNYFNLDPSLSLSNYKIDMGYEYIYSPTAESSFMDMSNIGEMYVYNRTYAYYDDLLEQAMTKIRLDVNSQFVTTDIDCYETYIIGGDLNHLIYWDPVALERTYDSKRAGVFLPKLKSFSSYDLVFNDSLDLPTDFYLIITAKYDTNQFCMAMQSRGYDIKDSFVVSNYLGYMTVVHFERGS